MPRESKPFKRQSRRHQPKGLRILHEDRDILVVDKVSGLLTVANETVRDRTAHHLLDEYVRKGNPKSRRRIFVVHRLDRFTSGVLVFAKSPEAKRYLQGEWRNFRKTYYTVVRGTLKEPAGVITSYLAESPVHKMYAVADPKMGKLARTGYRVLKEARGLSLVELDLLTGRKNQIRVHLADRGCPVVGDRKYGKGQKGRGRLALHAFSLTLTHPHSRAEMTFTAGLPDHFETLMSGAVALTEAGEDRKAEGGRGEGQ